MQPRPECAAKRAAGREEEVEGERLCGGRLQVGQLLREERGQRGLFELERAESSIETAALSRASAQLAHHRVNHVFGHDGIRRHPLERTFGDQHRAAA